MRDPEGFTLIRMRRIKVRENKYDKILMVATDLISQRGYHGTSFQQIADEVGLHKSSLFHYFRNKEELVIAILENGIGEASMKLEKIVSDNSLTWEEKLEKAIQSHLTVMDKYFNFINIYLNELKYLSKEHQEVYLQKRKEYEADIERIIIQMKKNGHFKGLDSKAVTFGVLGMLNWTGKWYKAGGRLTMEEISITFCKMLEER